MAKHGRLFPTLLVLGSVLLSGLGCATFSASGNLVREERRIDVFREVEFAGMGTVAITVGEPHSVWLETDEDVIGSVRTEVRNGRLRIWRNQGAWSIKATKLHVEVTLPELTGVEVNGSTRVTVSGPVRTDSFSLRGRGSTRVVIDDFAVRELDARFSGSATFVAAGRADRLQLETAGSARMHLADLQVASVDVSMAGSGEAELYVTSALKGEIAGSGVLRLKGSPPQIRVETRGSGRLIQDALSQPTTPDTPNR